MTINPKLLEPTLLWENPNPNVAFNNYGSSHPITISNDYNYLVFAYKNDSGDKTIFYSKQSGKWGNATMYYPLTLAKPNNYTYYRNFVRTSATSGYFDNGKNGIEGRDDNTVMLPIAIYGTNIL
jgi:hypothetical protein